jgi:transposase
MAGVAALTLPFPLPKVSAAHRQLLEATLTQDGDRWTLPSLRDDWQQQTGVHLRLTAFTALLGDLGYYSLPTIEPMPHLYRASRNAEERQAFTAAIIEQIRERQERWWC